MIISLSMSDSVNVIARGRAISSAVDFVEVTKRSFLTDLIVEDIDVGRERLGEACAEPNVLIFSIQLSKPNA